MFWEHIMQTLLAVHGISPFGRQGRFGTVALVGALHLGAIYALLVSLDVVPSPIKPPPIFHIRMIDKTPPKPQRPPTADSGVILLQPEIPIPPKQPKVDVTVEDHGPAIDRPDRWIGPRIIPPVGPTLPVRALAATHTIPAYPPLAIRLAHEGTTRLKIIVDEQGNVVSADVLQSSAHPELDAAAVAWVKAHWRYQPAMQDGHAVSATTEAVVTFRLDQPRG
jgi:protein TonB